MQAKAPAQRDLLLVGGGHAHVIALRMLAMRPLAGLRITLISPDAYTPYSGMLPGLIAGHYSFEQSHIDLERLCYWAGARFIRDRACALDVDEQALYLEQRPALGYDLLSLDIGSQPELDSVPGARAHSVAVKPVSGLWQRWCELRRRLANEPGRRQQLAVVGGGAGSVEVILAMAYSLRREPVSFTLVSAAQELLPGYNPRARREVLKALAEYGVTVHCAARVQALEAGTLHFDGSSLGGFDEIFWCTGASAAPWLAESALPSDERGFLLLRNTLQVQGFDTVFAAGDVAIQQDYPRPRAGVFAVRQGPVLANNLRRYLLGQPLREHRPQQQFLSILALGEREATADRGPFSVSGAWVWRWKDRIDRKFMQRFQDLPSAMPQREFGSLPELDHAKEQMPCGGCGAKIAADDLAWALGKLRQQYPAHCPAEGAADDVAPIPNASGAVVMQSLDILRELVSDPWLMGRIAANHALSDLYASGLRPVSALAAVTLPFAAPALQRRDLRQMLAGALEEFAAVDCALLGGHSLQGSELGLGFVVNGVALATGQILPKRGLQLGDSLVLTKPLGTGVLFAAQMQQQAKGSDIEAAIAVMLQSNFAAARLAVEYKASAATDVTGFGLLCHALEMLAPDQRLLLEPAEIPLIAGASAAFSEGIRSTMHEPNRKSALAFGWPTAAVDSAEMVPLYDPQTSGGLLLGIAAERTEELLGALRAAGYADASVIGKVGRLNEAR
ncbi:selenide, water dikinase SelD [Parahaliea sp. F7430]|uniref:Selenide, water dikinase SelD n=1 Tax=Sediminihaliea albiluteola TaxID=2758564 RepID=A0A7W2YJS0_9GAMM|nr:selenide, water dikinase SelD [Sediminihaliea albiluteola]MBA6413871.1 selenide, water dikinase SelD [Sediminihaliea albiluteola]